MKKLKNGGTVVVHEGYDDDDDGDILPWLLVGGAVIAGIWFLSRKTDASTSAGVKGYGLRPPPMTPRMIADNKYWCERARGCFTPPDICRKHC